MKKKIIRALKNDGGAVPIVEGAIVYPVVFFTIAFLLFFGNALHEKSKIDSIAMRAAVYGASSIQDPFYMELINAGVAEESQVVPPDFSFRDSKPYRYFFGVAGVEEEVKRLVERSINNDSTRIFVSQINNEPIVNAKFNNYVFYSTFSVDIVFSYKLPFSWGLMELPPVITLSSRAEVPLNDAPEFIKNTDMIVDFYVQSGLEKKINDLMNKVKDYFNLFGREP
jgi:hypothetical protein